MSAAFVIVGVILEAVGFLLSWRSIAIEDEAVQRFQKRPIRVTAQTVMMNVTTFATGTVRGDPPTMEQRIDSLERQIEAHRKEVHQRFIDQSKDLKKHVGEAVNGLSEHFTTELSDLARLVQTVHQNSTQQRWGLVLFVFGAALSGGSQFV